MKRAREVRFLSIVGARPQFIKVAPVCNAVKAYNRDDGELTIVHRLVHTGQHYDHEMADLLFVQLGIPQPDHNLGVGSGSAGAQLGLMMQRLEPVLAAEQPDWVLVYGDTNSTLAGSVIAARMGIPVAHVEAGCRSYNMSMPEEQNRLATDHLSRLLLAPSQNAIDNLRREGIGADDDPLHRTVAFVGDLMFDALLANLKVAETRAAETLRRFSLESGRYYLLTLHRAENTDNPENLRSILAALEQADFPVLFPVHPRTRKVLAELSPQTGGKLQQVPPLGYLEMLCAEKHARKILTDSGGVQKEAFYLSVPCVTLRTETEWPETVEAGANVIVGVDRERIVGALQRAPQTFDTSAAPFGRGDASRRVLDELLRQLVGRPAAAASVNH